MNQTSDITNIKGIGEKTAKLFNKLSVFTVEDLISFYPRDYEDYRPITAIANKKADRLFTFEGFIGRAPVMKQVGKLKLLIVTIKDETGSIDLTWFNMPYMINKLKLGTRIIVRGKVVSKNGRLSMPQPQILSPNEYIEKLRKTQPIYSLTKGLSNNLVTKSVKQALAEYDFPKDYLALSLRRKYDLINRSKALEEIHFPNDKESMLKARKRLAFDEFFIFSLALRGLSKEKNETISHYRMNKDEMVKDFLAGLSFELTKSQQRVLKEIFNDMKSALVMNRLIQGDVGCGKTIIAAISLLLTVENGYQGALMVPTQVLATQHFENIKELFKKYDVTVELLTGNTKAAEKRRILSDLKSGKTDILIGTHAIIEDNIEFDNLALIITDEQHRFGVRQRAKIGSKGTNPDVLVMTATPIPRTLALILYGDLDISIIDELPPNRKKIDTFAVTKSMEERVNNFIKNKFQKEDKFMLYVHW